MAAILQVSRHLTLRLTQDAALDAMSFEAGVYVIVEGEPKGGETSASSSPWGISQEEADKLLEAYPLFVKEFKDNEPIANLVEWKRKNTVELKRG